MFKAADTEGFYGRTGFLTLLVYVSLVVLVVYNHSTGINIALQVLTSSNKHETHLSVSSPEFAAPKRVSGS